MKKSVYTLATLLTLVLTAMTMTSCDKQYINERYVGVDVVETMYYGYDCNRVTYLRDNAQSCQALKDLVSELNAFGQNMKNGRMDDVTFSTNVKKICAKYDNGKLAGKVYITKGRYQSMQSKYDTYIFNKGLDLTSSASSMAY